jgi:hypothetical protein
MNDYGFYEFMEKILIAAGGILIFYENYEAATMMFTLAIYCLVKTFDE